MKKIFVYGIAASMLFVGVISSCSKKDDSSSSTGSTSSTTSTSGTTSTSSTSGTNPTPASQSITYDGKSVTFLQTDCNLDAGSSNIYTMHSSDGDATESFIKFYGTPTAKAYDIVLTPPTVSTPNAIQLNLKLGTLTYTAQADAASGRATKANVTIENGSVRVTFSNAKFVKTGAPEKTISGDIICD
jgi:hypothetical protein